MPRPRKSDFRKTQEARFPNYCAKRISLLDKQRPSLRAAIDLMCIECMGMQRAEVKRCTAPLCPLYRVRPFQRSDDEEIDDEEE